MCKKPEHTNNIQLTDDVGIIMNYPKISNVAQVTTENTENIFEIIKGCIDKIYDQENVHEKNDISAKELDQFVNSMSHNQFMKIQEFFDTAPKVQYKTKIKNPKTKVTSDLVIEGLQNFF